MAAIEEAPNRPTAHLPLALDQAVLVKSLCKPGVFGPDIERVTVIETHISYVLLTGPYAYKIKKAVDLAFLDFTTLDARRFYCHEELRLNRPFAPFIYLDVVAVTGTAEAPAIGGGGTVLGSSRRPTTRTTGPISSRSAHGPCVST